MGRKKDKVWKEFVEVEKDDGTGKATKFAICNHCKVSSYAFPNASRMKDHLMVCKSCPKAVKDEIQA